MFNTKQQSILILFVLAFSALIIKAAQLQVIDKSYQTQANRTTVVKKKIYPTRGLIYDRNGKLLVQNNPIYNLDVTYNALPEQFDTAKLCQLLEIDQTFVRKQLQKNWRDKRYSKSVPFTFLSKVSPQKMGRFLEHLHDFRGFAPTIRNIRTYPHTSASHLLGFMGEADQSDIDNGGFDLGDYLGKTGIELQFDSLLRGVKGQEFVLKDNVGREISEYQGGKNDVAPVAGQDLVTTLDLELQSYLEELMVGKKGSIVALEPKTGEILAMVSAPSYDPNALNIDADRGEVFQSLLNDTLNKPFLDRSLNAKYPPGSIFKPILSLIAMQEGVWESKRFIKCPGYYQYRTFKYGCHEHPSPLSMKAAIQTSCNSYFFQMLRDLVEKEGWNNPEIGLTILNDHLNDFGLGRPLGIDLPGERKGFIPTPAFYNKLYNDRYSSWKSTYIMSIGIGQGELELTTLQIANLAAILANRGFYRTPHVLKALIEPGTSLTNQLAYQTHTVDIDKVHFEPVIEGMRRTIEYGTGGFAKVPGIVACGKTGTAQNPFGEDHSVFFAFAPIDDPQIAVAVFVENAGFGATVAAPMTGLILEKYLKGAISPYMKNTERRVKQMNFIN